MMNIRCLGCNSVYDSNSVFRRAATGENMLMLTRSKCRFSVKGLVMKVPADTLIIFDGKYPVGYAAEGCPLVCDWICFEGEKEQEQDFIDSLELTYNRPICSADAEMISDLIRNIGDEFYSLGSRRVKTLDSLMRTLLVKAGDSTGVSEETEKSSAPHYDTLAEIRKKIYRSPEMKWNVDTMAAGAKMSRSYFQHLYHDTFGVSCIADVINGKIEKAKKLLCETDSTVSHISVMCGYDNEEHFMRQFKKTVGVTPTAFRKQLLNAKESA